MKYSFAYPGCPCLLISRAKISIFYKKSFPLIYSTGHEKIVELLLRSGANSLHQDQDGNTAFHKAAANNHKVIMDLLYQTTSQPDRLINMRNKNNQTANDLLK